MASSGTLSGKRSATQGAMSLCCKNKILTSRSPVPTQKYHFLVHGSRGMTIPPIPPFILYDPRPVHEDSGEITPVGQQHLACHPCNPTRDMMCRAATMQPCPCHRAVTTNQPCHRCRSVLCRQRPQEDHSSSSESLRTGTGAVQLCLLWHRPEPPLPDHLLHLNREKCHQHQLQLQETHPASILERGCLAIIFILHFSANRGLQY